MALVIKGEGYAEVRNKHSIRVTFYIENTATQEVERVRNTYRVEKTTKDVQKRCIREFRAELENSQRLDAKRITFGQYADDWAAERVVSIAPRTAHKEAIQIRNLKLFFNDMILAEITRKDVKNWLIAVQTVDKSGKAKTLSGKPASKTTTRGIFKTLKQMMQEAVIDGILNDNPCANIKAPKSDTKEKDPLTAKEVAAFRDLLDAGEPRPTLVALRLCLFAGLRRSEAVGVRWSDFDAEAGTVAIKRAFDSTTRDFKAPKTEAGSRVIPLDPGTVGYLRRFRAIQAAKFLKAGLPMEDACICAEVGCEYMHSENLTRACIRFTKAYGFREGITPHVLRHTFCTLLCAAGVDVKTAQHLMGHNDPMVTLKTYAHYIEKNGIKAAASVDALMESLPKSNVVTLDKPAGRYGIKAVAV